MRLLQAHDAKAPMAVDEKCAGCGHLRVSHYDLSTKLGCAFDACGCKLPPEPREFVWPQPAKLPRVSLRIAEDDEIPKSAKTCIKYAAENDWEIRQAHFMRGCMPNSLENWAWVEDTEVFRLHAKREDLEVAATWVNSSFFFCLIRSISRQEVKQINSRDLWAVLKLELV